MKRIVFQAEASKQEAEANIKRKLNILSGWVTSGIPYQETDEGAFLIDSKDIKQIDFYPTSLRQFKAWDGSQNCPAVRSRLPEISATGNDTLAKRPAMQEQARRVVEALRQRAKTQQVETSASEVKRLAAELEIARSIIGIRNAELRDQQRILRRVDSRNSVLQQKIIGDSEEFRRQFERLENEIADLREKNAALIAQISKLRPLRQKRPA
ncbi:hypothetical protein [Burkholderia ubonensis]|uniref:hypothetical protein n=1 Tax=Burkholderia ubonensis TaxID=101571 RepID=UPI000B135295|nr:hypothetical protein [Burkholderia ubonensis]